MPKFIIHHSPFTIASWVALALSSCAYLPARAPVAPPSSQPHLVALNATECRALLRDDAPATSLEQAIARSVDYLQKLPPDRTFAALDRRVTASAVLSMLSALLDSVTAGADAAPVICDRFRVYRVDAPQRLLVTGYYEPELSASRTRSNRFRYPLYRAPDDLVDVDVGALCAACNGRVVQGRVKNGKLVPYYSRAEIDAGALAGREYEMAWLDDPVEAFFLHVQGSARLRFDDGVHMQISFSSSNGRPYTSIGRVLVEQGKVSPDAASLQSVKDYLRAHPDEQGALMATNQRYIFFRAVAAGPIGSLGVPLTAGRSMAADAGVYPPGALAFLRVAPRNAESVPGDPRGFQRLTLIQDAGAAITGPNRLDVFWGTGSTAESIAGEMRNPGELYLVLPN